MTEIFHDRERDLLIVDVRQPDEVIKIVPGSVKLANGYVAFPRNLYNLQLLAHMKLPLVPAMDDYDWPIAKPWRPREHQKLMANFMVTHPHCANLSDMGTQKTLATLWAADFVMQQYPPGECRALITAPLSILQRVWGDAIFQHFMGRRSCVILHGSADKRTSELAKPADFYIINHDGVGVGARQVGRKRFTAEGFCKELAGRSDIKIVIIDEAGAYRDAQTRRSRLAQQILAPRDYVWPLTGSPTPNGPTDAYGIAKLYNNARGEKFNSFKQRTMYQVGPFRWLPVKGSHVAARNLLEPAIRFAAEDCNDLPPCTTQRRDVELSVEQQKAYDEMRRQLVLTIREGQPITAVNEGVLRLKLLQIACGAIYGPEREVNLVDAKPRLAALREVMAECTHKIICFAPFTSVVHTLYKELKDDGFAMITGSTPLKERNEIFRAFQQDESPKGIVADPGTMSHGLDLFAATTIVWYCPTDKTEVYLQANKRIDRPGQTHPTTIVQIASTPVEREIYRRLENNQNLQGAVLELARQG